MIEGHAHVEITLTTLKEVSPCVWLSSRLAHLEDLSQGILQHRRRRLMCDVGAQFDCIRGVVYDRDRSTSAVASSERRATSFRQVLVAVTVQHVRVALARIETRDVT